MWLWSIIEHGSTLFICGHDSFRFDMVPFCILSDDDSFISYTYVGSAYIFMAMICIWTCMSQRSVLSDIYLSFRYLCSSISILDSLLSPYSVVSFIMYFCYHLPLLPHTLGGICYSSKWHIFSYGHFPMISLHVDTSWKPLKKHLYWRIHIHSFVTSFDLFSIPLEMYLSQLKIYRRH